MKRKLTINLTCYLHLESICLLTSTLRFISYSNTQPILIFCVFIMTEKSLNKVILSSILYCFYCNGVWQNHTLSICKVRLMLWLHDCNLLLLTVFVCGTCVSSTITSGCTSYVSGLLTYIFHCKQTIALKKQKFL